MNPVLKHPDSPFDLDIIEGETDFSEGSMNYITSQEAAVKWGLTRRTVQLYCQSGKIPGAVNPGKQWLIPETAPKPEDGRFSKNRHVRDAEPYHFPLLVYTRHFLSVSELTEDERSLLEAQLLNLRCEHTESVFRCRKLISKSRSVSVRFGALFTNMSNYMFLGLTSEIPACMKAMESICADASPHSEDYRLILAFFAHTYRFDPSRYLAIDVSMLSQDAVITYKLITLAVSLFSDDNIPESTIRFFETSCIETDLLGIAPASITMHGLLAMLHSRKGNMDAKLLHMDEVCRIGYENDLIRLLAKCASLDIDNYVRRLRKYGEAFASDIRDRCIRNRNNWQLAFKAHSGENPMLSLSIFEHEFLLLLVYKTSIHDLAALKNMTEKEARKVISDLCEHLSVGSRKELIELYKETFHFTTGNQPPGPPTPLPVWGEDS